MVKYREGRRRERLRNKGGKGRCKGSERGKIGRRKRESNKRVVKKK